MGNSDNTPRERVRSQTLSGWLSRRWYRSLLAFSGCCLCCALATYAVLVSVITNDIAIGVATGFVCGIAMAILNVLMSVIGAARMLSSIRGCLAVVVPTLASLLVHLLPLNLDLQVIPVVMTYCICFGSVTAALAMRGYYADELVARGSRILRTSNQTSDAVLVAYLVIFFWAQYVTLGGWYLSKVAPAVLAWSIVLVLATSWGFLALSRFGERRLAYSIAIPTAVVAMISLYVRFRYQGSVGLQWAGFGAFALTSLLGWFLAQEVATHSLGDLGWKWRSFRRSRRRGRTGVLQPKRARIRLNELAWNSIAMLALVTITCAVLPSLINKVFTPHRQLPIINMSVFAVSQGVGAATGGAILALVSHLRIGLWRECLLYALLHLSISIISTPILSYSLYHETGAFISSVVIAVGVAIVMHLVVRVMDQVSSATFGTVQQQCERVSIGSLLLLTLVIGLWFASLRFADSTVVTFGFAVTLYAAIVAMISMRIYLLGPTWPSALAAIGMIALATGAGYYYRQYLSQGEVLIFCVYVATVIAVTRWLKRQGWQKVDLSRASLR